MTTTVTRDRTSAATRTQTLRRLAFLLPGGFALLAGLDAALLLLDLPAPVERDRLADVHGMLLVLGFVGTLISLERAVALRSRLGFAAPAFLGLAAFALVSPLPLKAGQTLLVAGTAAFVCVYVPLWRRQRDEATLVQSMGAVLATGAALLWLGGVAIPALVPWLVAFVVLTIVGERLELTRIEVRGSVRNTVVLLCALLIVAVVGAVLWPEVGYRLSGIALLSIAVVLARYDVARRTIRAEGLPRYAAACMLAAYAWLAVAATIWLLAGPALDGEAYDAVLHAVFLGFTMSMIMAHASVILPAVLRIALPYHRAFYVPAALLHVSLVLRLLVGDAWGVHVAWQVGGVLNITALLLFVGLAVTRALTSKGAPR